MAYNVKFWYKNIQSNYLIYPSPHQIIIFVVKVKILKIYSFINFEM
jgi:hypothetical protein